MYLAIKCYKIAVFTFGFKFVKPEWVASNLFVENHSTLLKI